MINLSFPETWWWKNYRDGVVAITVETVLGKGGMTDDWIEPLDQKKLGKAMAEALIDY